MRSSICSTDRGDWVRIGDIEVEINIRRGRLTSMLKILEVEGVVERDGTKYRRTALAWTYPTERIENVTAQRRAEQRVMDDYIDSDTCLMALLGRALDDPTATACGRCSRCTGTSLPVELEHALVVAAQEYLRSQPLTIDPRKMRAAGGKIPAELQLETGRTLSFLGDGGWGRLVRDQREAGEFSDELVEAAARLVRTWGPEPRPTWVTSVPSSRAPELVASLARRIADRLAALVSARGGDGARHRPPGRDGEQRPATSQRRGCIRDGRAGPGRRSPAHRRHRGFPVDTHRGRRRPAGRRGRGGDPAHPRSGRRATDRADRHTLRTR